MKIRTRINNWVQEHRHDIFAASIFLGAAATYIYLAQKAGEAQAEWNQRVMVWTIEENRAGRTVFQLADGSLISVAV